MKTIKTIKTKLIILIFCLGFLNNALGQVLTDGEDQSPQDLYDFHISKKKANNTAGWIFLSGGVAMVVGGFLINANTIPENLFDETKDINSNDGLWLSYVGGAATLASIPLFMASGKHNKKAKVELQNGAVGFQKRVNYSGISIVFSF